MLFHLLRIIENIQILEGKYFLIIPWIQGGKWFNNTKGDTTLNESSFLHSVK